MSDLFTSIAATLIFCVVIGLLIIVVVFSITNNPTNLPYSWEEWSSVCTGGIMQLYESESLPGFYVRSDSVIFPKDSVIVLDVRDDWYCLEEARLE